MSCLLMCVAVFLSSSSFWIFLSEHKYYQDHNGAAVSFIHLMSILIECLHSFIQLNLESSLIISLLWITSAAKQTESHIPSPSLSICLVWPECLLLIKKSTYPFWNWLIIRSDLTSFCPTEYVCLSCLSFCCLLI